MNKNTIQYSIILGLGLGAFALIRPIERIVVNQLGFTTPPAFPLVVTAFISLVWIIVAGLNKTNQPLLTLLTAGVTYAVLAIGLSGVLSPLLDGQLQGPLANPIAILPMLFSNALWGLITGAIAYAIWWVRHTSTEHRER